MNDERDDIFGAPEPRTESDPGINSTIMKSHPTDKAVGEFVEIDGVIWEVVQELPDGRRMIKRVVPCG